MLSVFMCGDVVVGVAIDVCTVFHDFVARVVFRAVFLCCVRVDCRRWVHSTLAYCLYFVCRSYMIHIVFTPGSLVCVILVGQSVSVVVSFNTTLALQFVFLHQQLR